jgi:CO/xanthine dehydrogenase Mo-binding subunit
MSAVINHVGETTYLLGNPNVNRRDIMRKITGQAVYTYDINPSHIGVSNMFYMGMVTCPYPRANIISIDTSAAEASGYPTLTAADLPSFAYWGSGRTRTPLPSQQVLYAGQPVVAVAAPTTDEVEDAVSLVKAEFEPLPWVMDPEEALKSSAPQLFPGGNLPPGGFTVETGPVPASIKVEYGNVDQALAQADVKLGPVRIDTQLESHYEMEPWACVAVWTGGPAPVPGPIPTTAPGPVLRMYVSSEFATADQAALAAYFGIPINNVIVSTSLGGGEGGGVLGMALGDKIAGEHLAITAAMAKKVGAAVKYGPTRMNQAQIMNARFPMRGYVTLGAMNDGTFTVMDIQLYEDSGAYSGSVGTDGISDMTNLYNVPNVRILNTPVNTNSHKSSGAMRDVGESQGHFIMETAVDMLAEKLGMDPVQFRLKNMRTSATAVDPQTNFPYSGFGQPAAFNNALNAFNWPAKWQGWGKPSSIGPTTRNGVGLALHNGQKGALSPPCTAQIQVNSDGSVIGYTGLTDHGAGGNTTYALECAEALGLTSVDNVSLVQSDTSLTTPSGVTAGSRSARVGGMAFIYAAENLKTVWLPILQANNLFQGVSPSQLKFTQDTIVATSGNSDTVSFATAASFIKPYNASKNLPPYIKGFGTFVPPTGVAYRVGGAKFAEVQVDIESGEVHVVNFVSGMDIGKVLFFKGAESQARGGFFMGLGETLYQEYWNDPTTGRAMNPNFHDFKIPTIMETPDNIVATWDEYGDRLGPWGAKGIGENTLMAVSPAIANALSNALGGYRFTKLPITREDIIRAIQWARQNGKL